MASEEFRVELTADNEISDEARDAAAALDKIPDKVKVSIDADTGDTTRDLGQIMEYVDQLGSSSARIVLQDNAKSIQTEIKGLLVDIDRLDAADPQVTIKIDQINQLEGQLGQIETKVDSLGTREIDIQTGAAKRGIDDLGKSADSSKSVLANMVGNASQDLSALGGVAGSVGVAIGQIGEYAVDAASGGEKLGSVLRSFAGVALPIAGIAVALKVVTDVAGRFSSSAARGKASVDAWASAMRDGGDASASYAEALEEVGQVTLDVTETQSKLQNVAGSVDDTFRGLVPQFKLLADVVGASDDETKDMTETLTRAGVKVGQWARFVEGGAEAQAKFKAALAETNLSGDEQSQLISTLAQAQEAHAKAAENDAVFTRFFGEATDDAADGVGILAGLMGSAVEEYERVAAASEEAAEKQERLTDALDGANAGFVRARDAAGLMSNALDTFNTGSDLDFSAMASDTVESFDKLKEALGEVQALGSKPLVPTTVEDLRGLSDESAAVIDSLGGMRDAIQTELVAAMDAGGGSFSSFTEKAEFFRNQVLEQFPAYFEGLGLSSEEAAAKTQEVLAALGLLPEQVATQVKLEGDELALQKIGLFGSAIDDLPPEVQAKVFAAVDEGNPQEAWQLIKAGVDAEGAVEVQTLADPTGAQAAIDELTGQDLPPATVTVEGDTAPAETAVAAVTGGTYDATVDVDSDTSVADSEVEGWRTRARETSPITAVAYTANAEARIRELVDAVRTAIVNVAVGTIRMPSGADLANQIGPVRVPIDLYVRTSPRLDGG